MLLKFKREREESLLNLNAPNTHQHTTITHEEISDVEQ